MRINMKIFTQKEYEGFKSFIAAHSSSEFQINHTKTLTQSDSLKRPTVFLHRNKQGDSTVTYTVATKLEEEISDYAYDRIKEITNHAYIETDKTKRATLVKMGKYIKQDFEAVDKSRGILSRIWNTILVALHVRHSEKEIEESLKILERSEKAPQFGEIVSSEQAQKRIDAHRNAGTNSALVKAYGADSLTKAANKVSDELIKSAHLPVEEPQKQIAKARLKEQGVRHSYDNYMQANVDKGFYDPGVIPREIDRLLGPLGEIPTDLDNDRDLNRLLEKEVDKYKSHLNRHQLHYIKHDIKEAMILYREAYPKKSRVDAFVLGRDMIRVAIYQEYYDKASFTGSDHGSKHIHHNIENADGLHSKMELDKDYNAKDKFMEHFIHFYHDIGYTTGLSANSFDCCKDHPFIGAKMIDENREYFKYYLGDDDAAVDIFKEGVLFHAIAMPNLTTDKEMRAGMHPNMIRAVTSISDACALTYDRKTQEFWEQPASLLALSRLRLFLTQFPQYINKLANPSENDEWFNGILNPKDPLDILAHDVFKATKEDLFNAADAYDVPKEKRELFKQAIRQQFNSFTTTTTLGQYGGVLTGVTAIRNDNESEGAPTYLPEFELAPSIIYGLLKDVYGEDLAQQSFKKLLDEFGVDIGVISDQLTRIADARVQDKIVPERNFLTPSAKFTIRNLFDVDPKDTHLRQMQKNLAVVVESVRSIYKSEIEIMPRIEKEKVFTELQLCRQGEDPKKCGSFANFVLEYVTPRLKTSSPQGEATVLEGMQIIQKFVEKADPIDKVKRADSEWENIFQPLRAHLKEGPYTAAKVHIESYYKDVAKLRGELPASQEINKLNEKFLSTCQSLGMDVGVLRSDIVAIQKNLELNAPKFNDAENTFFQINAALKMVLVSNEEYVFMVGEDAQPKTTWMKQFLGIK